MTDTSQASDGATGGQTTGDKLKQQFQGLKGQAGEKARDMAGQGKDKATSALDDAAKFLHETARTIEEKVGPQYGGYVHSAAERVEGFTGTIRDKDVEELLEQGRELVRKSPGVAIGVAASLGFVLARLIKSGMDYTPPAGSGSTGYTGSTGTQSLAGTTGSTGLGATGTTGTSGGLGGTGTTGSTGGLGGTTTGTTGSTGALGGTTGTTGATGLGGTTGKTGSSGLPTGGTSVTGSTEPTFPA